MAQPMTSRDGILTTVSHQQPDRVPIDLAGTRSTGIVLEGYEKLRSHFGVETKPLGSGIISTALKGKAVDQGLVDKCIEVMTSLNKRASELMKAIDIHACTDITGFGLLGHICEMIEGSDVGMVIDSSAVPYFHKLKELVEMGMVAGGLHRNKKFRMHMVDVAPHVPDYVTDIFFDPQTSGGLLFSLPEDEAEDIVRKMHAEGIGDAAIVGGVTGKPKGKILVR